MRNDAATVPEESAEKTQARHGASKRHAFLVAAGIFLSRIAGLVRQRIFAHYFGNSDAADAFNAAFRIPNFLQNLFGEGVLSASFIPVYAGLLARKDDEEARRTAGAVAALLALTTSILVLIGLVATPYLIDAIAPGFHGEKRELTIRLVRILFPGAGLLVFSAWCLGILNSHRRFFLSYTAPVIWNAAMIATLWGFGGRYAQYPLAAIVAWGSVVGSALQVAVQLPVVLRLLHGLKPSLAQTPNVKTVVHNFGPVFVGRGVVQISGYVDAWLASWLGTGALSAFSYAQILFTLPVSLFGMSVSAAELPHMSGALGDDREVAEALRARLDPGLRQIAFFVVPSVAAFLVLGDVIVAAALSDGPLHPQRRALRLGHSRGSNRWTARLDSRAALFIGVLRPARHAHAVALRHRASRAHNDPRLFVRDSAAASAGNRPALGRGGPHRVCGNCIVGGIHAPAVKTESPHRQDGHSGRLSCQALDRGGIGRRRGLADPPLLSRARARARRHRRAHPLRNDLSGSSPAA